MGSFLNKRNWWIAPVVAGILSIAVTLIQQKWLPDYGLAALVILGVLLGGAFYWVYTLDRQEFWWAQIPAMAMIALLATGIVAFFTPEDASGSSPYAVVTLGICAAIIGYVLKVPGAKQVLFYIAIIMLFVGVLMLPLNLVWTVILIVVDALLIGYLIWQTDRQTSKR